MEKYIVIKMIFVHHLKSFVGREPLFCYLTSFGGRVSLRLFRYLASFRVREIQWLFRYLKYTAGREMKPLTSSRGRCRYSCSIT